MANLAVELRNVWKRFPGPGGEVVTAVKDVSLQIADGEFFALLGPSGCGKTTSLRMIAGFELPTEGEVFIHGRAMGKTPPYQRPVNTVFQSYALFPHMTIGENVAFGLQMKGVAKQEIQRRVGEALEMVRLSGYERRKPKQLSGGQQQRIALARALVNRPEVLLLDEPLGALDLKLREQMQVELKTLQRNLGITFVFVTHDQGEALSMADRVAIFNEGKIAQVGSPESIYEQPQTRFVADFVGSSNVLPPVFAKATGGPEKWLSLRPEKIAILRQGAVPEGRHGAEVTVRAVHYQGAGTRLNAATSGGAALNVMAPSSLGKFQEGDVLTLHWAPDAAHVMEGEP